AEFNPRSTVYLPLEARAVTQSIPPTRSHLEAKVVAASFSAHRGDIQIEAQERSWLVIAQNNHHCWRAYSDGIPLRLWRANYAFQATVVPEGKHLVQLVYRDWGFVAGTVLSLLTLTGCIWIEGRGAGARRRGICLAVARR